MKRLIVSGACVLRLFTCNPAMAQQAPDSQIPEYRFQLSENKTGNIIFPYAIKSVDRGSGDVIAQVVQGFGNILQLKASMPNFKQTNVTIITSDGKFYSFLIDYNSDPKVLNLSFKNDGDATGNESIALPDDYNAQALDSDATSALRAKFFLHKGVTNEQMRLRVAGIYLKDGLMWFKLKLDNLSHIAYDIDNIAFAIVDKKQVKRTARQEVQLQQIYIGTPEIVTGKTSREIILAFKPVTIPGNKKLKVSVSERAGGRTLILQLKAKKLLRARLLKT